MRAESTEGRAEVVVQRWIAASPDTVFSFFTDGDRWAAWQGVAAEVDARPGGALRVVMPDAAVAAGEFLEVVQPVRITFTWGWHGNDIPLPPGSSSVTIELRQADGGTMLKLTHAGLPPDLRDLHEMGWQRYLGRLALRATGGNPGPDGYEPA